MIDHSFFIHFIPFMNVHYHQLHTICSRWMNSMLFLFELNMNFLLSRLFIFLFLSFSFHLFKKQNTTHYFKLFIVQCGLKGQPSQDSDMTTFFFCLFFIFFIWGRGSVLRSVIPCTRRGKIKKGKNEEKKRKKKERKN